MFSTNIGKYNSYNIDNVRKYITESYYLGVNFIKINIKKKGNLNKKFNKKRIETRYGLINIDEQTEFFNLPGEIASYNDITKIGCAYRNFLSSIMQNGNIEEPKKVKLIFHVRSILYCYIINIGLTYGDGKKYFDKAKKFFTNNVENSNTLGNFKSTEYEDDLFEDNTANRYGSWSMGGKGNAYYPKLLADNKFVDEDGLLKAPEPPPEAASEPVATPGTSATPDTPEAVTGGRSRRNKKRKTTKKKRIKRRKTTKKKRVKRRKYSLKK